MAAVSPRIDAVAALAHGATPVVRRVRPGDAAMIDAFVQRLSPASRRRRFHGAIRALPAEWLERMTHPDAQRELALVATVVLDGAEHCIGEARYVVADDPRERGVALVPDDSGEREFALVVSDGWQGCGIGRSMLRQLDRHAARHGVQRLYGDVLRDNLPMIELARSLDFSVGRHPTEARLVRVQRVLHRSAVPSALQGPSLAGPHSRVHFI